MRLGLTFDPLLPLGVVAALAAVLALAIALVALRRLRGTPVRALVSALLVLALLNPVLQREEREPLPGIVALVVDDSSSQRLGDRRAQTEAALARVKERIGALGTFEVREARAGDSPPREAETFAVTRRTKYPCGYSVAPLKRRFSERSFRRSSVLIRKQEVCVDSRQTGLAQGLSGLRARYLSGQIAFVC